VVRYEGSKIDGTVVFDGCGNVRVIGGNVASTIAKRLETRELQVRSGDTDMIYSELLDVTNP